MTEEEVAGLEDNVIMEVGEGGGVVMCLSYRRGTPWSWSLAL